MPVAKTPCPSPSPETARHSRTGDIGIRAENTVGGVQTCLSALEQMEVELDVQLSSDGHPVVLHDAGLIEPPRIRNVFPGTRISCRAGCGIVRPQDWPSDRACERSQAHIG